MYDLIQQILDNPLTALAVVGNLILIESLLSVDNAAVLATMVMDLPSQQRKKALRYGIFGAYIFRGLALLFAAFIIRIWWLKPLGGFYLLYLVYDWWKSRQERSDNEEAVDKGENWVYRSTVGALGTFWATVALVEVMDMAFSIDNVFAAVAFSKNIILVWTGVFIGILAMRFVAQAFVKLMETYAFLEVSAFIVIAILGVKLVLSIFEHFVPESPFSVYMGSHAADISTSVVTVTIFFLPILSCLLFNYPKKQVRQPS
jgi:YkoY family integral membrane protein